MLDPDLDEVLYLELDLEPILMMFICYFLINFNISTSILSVGAVGQTHLMKEFFELYPIRACAGT